MNTSYAKVNEDFLEKICENQTQWKAKCLSKENDKFSFSWSFCQTTSYCFSFGKTCTRSESTIELQFSKFQNRQFCQSSSLSVVAKHKTSDSFSLSKNLHVVLSFVRE